MNTPAQQDGTELQPAMVGNPMLVQVRDFIDADDGPPALDTIGIFLRALRGRERRVAFTTLVVALLAATAAYLAINPVYQSSAMLRVLPRDNKILYSDSDDSRLQFYDTFVTTETQILTSDLVLQAALRHMKVDHDNSYPLMADVDDMVAMVTATGKKGVISLVARSGDPRLSAAIVNSIVTAYGETNDDNRREISYVRRDELQTREGDLENALNVLNRQLHLIGGEHNASTLVTAHVAKTDRLEVLEQRITDLDHTINQLQLTGGVGADVGNNVEIQRATLLDRAMADMTYERAQRLSALETLRGRYRPSHPRLRSAKGELTILEAAIAERRDQIAMLGEAGALTGNDSGSGEESVDDLQMIRTRLTSRRQAVRTEAAELNRKLTQIRGIESEKERLEELLAETRQVLNEVLLEKHEGHEGHEDMSRPFQIIMLGRVPMDPIEDKRKPLALGAGVFSSLGVLALVIAGSVLAGRVRFSDDLDERSRDVLAAVVAQDRTPAEGFAIVARRVRNEFDLRWPTQGNEPLVLAVVGVEQGDGTTSMTSALGTHYAGTGRKVLVIDAACHDNGLSRLHGVTGDKGAGEIARGEAALADYVRVIGEGEGALNLLPSPAGVDAEDDRRAPRELALDDMRALLDATRAEYDLVILDLGALKPGGQSAVGSALADRTLLVAACGGLRQEITEARDLLERLTASRYLLTLNNAPPIDPALSTSRRVRRRMPDTARGPLTDLPQNRNGN